MDETITTVGDFLQAVAEERLNQQLYVQTLGTAGLWEVTEIIKVLSKKGSDESYIVLRCR